MRAGFTGRIPMRKTMLTAAALVLFSSAVMAQSTETKSPATLGRSLFVLLSVILFIRPARPLKYRFPT
jgi:hypothetical protein